jgi:hypothetical protein
MGMPDPDLEKVVQILNENKALNFVQRILDPGKFPTYSYGDEDEQGRGNWGTHRMSYSTVDDGAIAYPEIVFDEISGKLKRLGRQEAAQHALKTKQFIKFPTPEDAEWFGNNYKRAWLQGGEFYPTKQIGSNQGE